MKPQLNGTGDWAAAKTSAALATLANAAPTPRLEQSLDFLRWHAPEGLWLLTAIHPGTSAIDTKTFQRSDEKVCCEWLERNVAERNIYFHVNPPMHALTKKAGRDDIASLAWLHVDIDPRVGKDIDEERTRILSLLQDPPGGLPKPSGIVFSGGGYQGFWRLSDPLLINGEVDRAEEAKRYNIAMERAFGGDNCHNVDRIMRLPGTINWPDVRKAKKGRVPTLASAVELTDARFAIGDFTPEPPLANSRAATKRSAETPSVLRQPPAISNLSSLDEWNVPARVARIIEFGLDPEHRFSQTKDVSRSGWLWDAVCHLLRSGVPGEIVTAILLDRRWKISESVLEKLDPRSYADTQVRNASDRVSKSWHSLRPDGTPKETYANTRISILRLGIECTHDQFRDRQIVRWHPVRQYAGELSDHASASLRQTVLETDSYDPGKQNVRDAVHSLCLDNAFDPVADYLSGLVWDGQPRLDTWLTFFMGATDSSLNRAIGRKTLVAAVRRVFQPGCKFDYVPVLEGIQGSGKSTALRTLAGEDDLFSDQEVVHLDAKAQQEAVRGKFIYEIAELGGLNKTDVERTKAFLSRTHDRARPAYGYASIDQPRRCVFIATTNERGYLRDPTGNRRYWPVVTGVIHIDALKRDRDQLWAEAVVAHQNGEMLYLPPDLAVLISVEQDDRREEDPWISQLERVIAVVTGDEERMGSAKLLEYLGLPVKDQSRAHARRLKDCMNQLGWKGPEQLRVAGRSVKGYSREIAPQTAVE